MQIHACHGAYVNKVLGKNLTCLSQKVFKINHRLSPLPSYLNSWIFNKIVSSRSHVHLLTYLSNSHVHQITAILFSMWLKNTFICFRWDDTNFTQEMITEHWQCEKEPNDTLSIIKIHICAQKERNYHVWPSTVTPPFVRNVFM